MQVTWSDREIELGMVGRVGESNTRTITVDCAKIMDAYPAARIVCVLSRPDGATYTAPLAEDGKKRTVTLSAVDLAMPGTLRLELRAVEGGAVLKSAILRGTVADSIRGEGDAPGQPVRDVLDRVDDTLKAAEATRKELETALGGVQNAVDAATGAADAATAAAAAAEETDAQIQAAEQGRAAAEKKREQATAAAVQSVTDTVADVQNKLESGALNGKDGKDGLDAPQIDDTTVSDAAPWSSQHIVDMLCPPMTESGNPVVCYPVAGSTLGIKARWEPTQEGEGTPYPAGGGPNLLDISQCTATVGKPYGLTITIDGDIIKASGIPSSEVTEEGDYSFAVATCAQTDLRGKGYKVTAFALKGNVSSAWGLRTEDESSLAVSAKLTPGVNTDIQLRLMVSRDTPAAYAPYSNIRPIHGRTQVKVERCGENLLPFSERIVDDYQRQIMASDALLLLSKACAEQELTLTFSVETQNIAFKDDADTWKKRIGFECHGILADGTETWCLQCWLYESSDKLTSNGKKTKTVTVTMPELASGEITFYVQNVKSGSFVAYDCGIYAGTTAPTTYKPYIGQTNTLTLPETVYGGTVDVVTGEGQETWKLLTLDGTENWNTWGVNANNSAVTGFFTYDINDYDSKDVKGICSNLSQSDADTWGGRNSGIGFATVGSSRYFMYCLPTAILADTSDNSAAIASLKAFLAAQYAAGTPVQIAYKLATPVPFTVTGGGIIKALSSTNTILTDADALTVTGRADPIHIIQQLQAASAASAQALADVERAVTDI